MYQKHPKFREPDDLETTVWHYIPFEYFVCVLKTQSLSFASIKYFQEHERGDPREGRTPPANRSAYRRAGKASKSEQGLSLVEAHDVRKAMEEHYLRNIELKSAMLPYRVAHCWHINEHESKRMWEERVPDGRGVVIKTTFRRLTESFGNAEKKLCYSDNKEIPVHAGIVQYIDRLKQPITYDPFSWELVLQKARKKFQHERELRVAADLSPKCFDLPFDYTKLIPYESDNYVPDLLNRLVKDSRISIPVDLNTLIETVVISPFAPPDFKQEVEDTLRGIVNANVELSSLNKH